MGTLLNTPFVLTKNQGEQKENKIMRIPNTDEQLSRKNYLIAFHPKAQIYKANWQVF